MRRTGPTGRGRSKPKSGRGQESSWEGRQRTANRRRVALHVRHACTLHLGSEHSAPRDGWGVESGPACSISFRRQSRRCSWRPAPTEPASGRSCRFAIPLPVQRSSRQPLSAVWGAAGRQRGWHDVRGTPGARALTVSWASRLPASAVLEKHPMAAASAVPRAGVRVASEATLLPNLASKKRDHSSCYHV